ncbi:MAG TPA: helix-turn-helix domain-containing protein, partial [Bacteroidia bacterium]
MTKNNKIFQQKWNEVLLAHAPESVSLAKEISDLLDISLDSAYRRLRNQTDYTLDEAAIIANHFNLPLEALNNERHSVVSFRTNKLTADSTTYLEYLQNMSASIRRVAGFEHPEIYFGAEDIPVYYHYGSENLMKFKVVYWLKSLLIVPEFQNQSFENINVPTEILE